VVKAKAKSGKKQKATAQVSRLSRKEQAAQKRKADRQRQEFLRFTGIAVLIGTLIGGLLALAVSPKIGAGALLAVLCLTFSFKYPRYAFWGLLIYLPFGGTITYAIGNSPLLQLAKDGFYLPGLFGVVQYCRRERLPILIPKPLIVPLVILLGCCCLTLLGANGVQQFFGKVGEKPIAMGILGIKVLMGYIPLIVCAYYLLRNRKDVLFLMRLTVSLIVICCSLGLVQYLFLLTGRCAGTRFAEGADLFKATLEARCLVGGSLVYSPEHGVIRLPGTFVAPWQWGWFLISSAFLAFSSAFNDPKPFWRAVGLSALGLDFIMAVVSGQRIALALVPTIVGVLLICTGQVANLKRFVPVAGVLGVVLGIVAVRNPETVQERLNSFVSRWDASPPHEFIVQQFSMALSAGGILGKGLGRATNSARALGETELIETYYPKLMYEIGPLGTIAFLIVVSVLTYLVFKAYRSLRDRTLRSYAAPLSCFILFISYNTYYYPLDVDPVAIYYWFFAGAVLKLPQIERDEQRTTMTAKNNPTRNSRYRRNQKLGFS
jgi:cell division protein FtsW (lipid II flippase)